jgi:hypothetical protein
MLSFLDSSPWPQPKVEACGKAAGQGIGVNDYSLILDALHLQHPRLLQRQGTLDSPPFHTDSGYWVSICIFLKGQLYTTNTSLVSAFLAMLSFNKGVKNKITINVSQL